MRPLVSILFPCYNAEKYLSYALESILNQDYHNLEIICINDGSSDNTLKLLLDYQTADTRIKIINNPQNIGLIDSLNNAIEHVTGEFFARMDADDYCPPQRIALQMQFINKNKQYQLVSSGYHYFIDNDKKMEYVPPIGTFPGALKFISLFSTPLTHASTLGRSELLRSGIYRYDKNFPHSEDYELFSRLAWQNVTMANLNEPLYWVRLNPESVSVVFNSQQINSHLQITRRNIERHLTNTEKINDIVLQLISNRIYTRVNFYDLKEAVAFLKRCFWTAQNNYKTCSNEKREIKKYLALHVVNMIIQSNKVGFKINKKTNFDFFVRSLTLLRPAHFLPIAKKIIVYIKYRGFWSRMNY